MEYLCDPGSSCCTLVKDCCDCVHWSKGPWTSECSTCGILQKNFVPVANRTEAKENKEMDKEMSIKHANDVYSAISEIVTKIDAGDPDGDITRGHDLNLKIRYPKSAVAAVEVNPFGMVPPINSGYKYPDPNAKIKREWISQNDTRIDYSSFYKGVDRINITPKRIWFTENGRTTTVEWMDGTKTTVRAEDPEKAAPYCGFTAALAKKIFGTGEAIRKMNAAIDKAKEPARIREEKRKAEKEKRKADEEQKRKSHDWRVARRVEELKIEQEARDQIAMELQKEASERPEGKELKKAFEQTAKELQNQSEGETKA